MANMFKEAEKHVTPLSLEDSLKTDKVIKDLWSWAAGLETLGKILFVVIIVIGVVSAIFSSFQVVPNDYGYRSHVDFLWGEFFLGLVYTALYAFIEFCAYHILALLVGALASIVQNTRAAARILEYKETVSDDEVLGNNRQPLDDEWKCSKCGNINKNYVGTCSCGQSKASN